MNTNHGLLTEFFALYVRTDEAHNIAPRETIPDFFEYRLRPMFSIIERILPHPVMFLPRESPNPIAEYSIPRHLMAFFLSNVVRRTEQTIVGSENTNTSIPDDDNRLQRT